MPVLRLRGEEMTACNFCPSGYLGGMAFHMAIPAPKPREAAAQNEFGDRACDRHMAELWAETARRKGLR